MWATVISNVLDHENLSLWVFVISLATNKPSLRVHFDRRYIRWMELSYFRAAVVVGVDRRDA